MAITQITKSIAYSGKYGILPFVTFRNVDRTGTVITKQLAVEFIPDPSSYAGGPKQPQVLTFGTSAKIASDMKGRNAQGTASILVADPDGSLAAWFEDPVLSNPLGIECSIDFRLTTDRLNSVDPAPNWHGLVKQPRTAPGGKIQLDCWDLIQSLGSQPLPTKRIGDYFTLAPTANLDKPAPRYYGTWSDEPTDVVAGAPVPVAEAASHATAPQLVSSLTSTSGDPLYGPLPATQVALAGFSSVQGVAGAPPAPTSLTLTEQAASGGSPGNYLGDNINGEAGYRGQLRSMNGAIPSDPFPYVLDDPTDPPLLVLTGVNKQIAYGWGATGGPTTGYELLEAQLGETLGPGVTCLRCDQILPVSGAGSTTATVNQAPHASDDPVSTNICAGARTPDFATRLAYALTWVTASGETGASVYWINRPSGWVRTIRGVVAFNASALTGNLYKSIINADGTLAGFTQRKVIPIQTNLAGDVFWEDDQLGTGWIAVPGIGSGGGGGGGATTQGKVPLLNAGGPYSDNTGHVWPLAMLCCAGMAQSAADGTFTAYSRDSSGTVTPLASLVDTQISVPGLSGYTTRWATNYFVVNGVRFVVFFLDGGLAADVSAGTLTIYVNGSFVESVGDGTGTLLVSPVDVKAHLEDNDILPLALGLPVWPGANWATTIPTYGDGRPARNAASYTAAKAFQLTIFPADVGALELTAARACVDLEAQLAVDCECANYLDENGAVALMPEYPNVNANVRTDLPITDVTDIVALTAAWQQQTTDDYYFNTLSVTFGGTLDASGSRQNQTTLPLRNATAIGNMRGRIKACSETLALLSRQDAASAAVIGNRMLARAAPAPRDASLQTFLYALGRSGFQVGDLIPVTDLTLRWSQKLLLCRSISTNWDTYAVTLGLRALNDPEALMAAGMLAWFFGGDNNNAITDTGYPAGSTVWLKGSDLWSVDSANLLPGSYQLQGMGQVPAGVTLKVGLFNLTDAPNTPLVELTFTNTIPLSAPIASAPITLAAPGAVKVYGVKGYVSGGAPGFGWGVSIVRTA